jgi:hypothetical protein
MNNFEEELQKELDKLPYTKHLDDGQYNDGQVAGFEIGARWANAQCQADNAERNNCACQTNRQTPIINGKYICAICNKPII